MAHLLRGPLVAGAMAIAAAGMLTASAVPAHALGVSGRTFVIYVNIPNAGISDQYYVDTGWLPAGGGTVSQSEASLTVPNLVSSGEVGALSSGDECRGSSTYTVSNGVLLPGDPAQITFTVLGGYDDDECCDEEDVPHAATIEGLTFGGESIAVTGQYDQTHSIVGVGTLTINEHGHDGGDDCGDDDDHWVNALHLRLEGGGEVIAGSAYFHSHDHCCTVSTQSSTWGGIKALFR